MLNNLGERVRHIRIFTPGIDKAVNKGFLRPLADKVMQLANQEAQRLNHEYIGTEHLLLALLKEGSGVPVSVLNRLEAPTGALANRS